MNIPVKTNTCTSVGTSTATARTGTGAAIASAAAVMAAIVAATHGSRPAPARPVIPSARPAASAAAPPAGPARKLPVAHPHSASAVDVPENHERSFSHDISVA